MNESGRKVFYSPLRISGRNEVECIGLERGAGSATAPHCRETRFISPAVSLRPGFSLLSILFVVCLFALMGDAALPEPSSGEPRSPAVLGLLGSENGS